MISSHNFDGIPDDIGDHYRAMRATGAAVVKVAAATRGLCDTLALAALGRGGGAERRVVIGMGPAGVASRVLAGRFGSCWTYAGDGVAPGQIELPRLRDEYRFPAITSRTAIYGVVGSPVSHSLSPAMHNAGFAAAGIDAVYLPLEARDVDDFVQFASAVPLRGASVTAPFKEALAARVADIDPVGRQVGAINTLRCGDTGWHGLNTDVQGFVETLLGRIRLPGVRAAVLGAGGAARAVAVALAGAGATVAICARDGAKGAAAAAAVGVTSGDFPPPAGSWDLLVNTTPAGTWPDVVATPLPDGPFSGRLVYDLVYNPATHPLSSPRPRRPGARRSGGWRCWWRRRSGSSRGGPAGARPDGSSGKPRSGRLARQAAAGRARPGARGAGAMTDTTFEQFAALAAQGNRRAGLPRGAGRHADAGVPPSSGSPRTPNTPSCSRAWREASAPRGTPSSARTPFSSCGRTRRGRGWSGAPRASGARSRSSRPSAS